MFTRMPPDENLDNVTYEQAYWLLEQQSNADPEVATAIAQGIKSRAIADASESYASAAERDQDPGWLNGVYYCPKALSWIAPFLGTPVRHGSYRARNWW